ncbi:MAG: DUF2997 domain-containing protein [Proteobacteria bacterium]|jgi:hypothetical protein|nr:DUF2997 domain-containing protein [Pseudomonadota bacterium]MBQ9816172.1 DUF2997 domain-containing protein [Pseudomonadota bacterium]
MATKQSIEFSINPDGSVEIHPVGFKGKKCMEVTKEIEEALGIVRTCNYTSEYYQQEEEVHTSVSVGSDGDK